jgi:hypothetical protein
MLLVLLTPDFSIFRGKSGLLGEGRAGKMPGSIVALAHKKTKLPIEKRIVPTIGCAAD